MKTTRYPIDNVDLCAGEVRVSAQGLKRLAEIAAFRSRTDCENYLREIQNAYRHSDDPHNNGIHAYLSAERLKYAATDLETSLRFQHAFDSLDKGERNELNLHPQCA